MNRSKLIHRQCTWVIQRQNTIRVTHVTLICNKTKQQQKINTNNTNVYITDNKNKRKQNYVKKKKCNHM